MNISFGPLQLIYRPGYLHAFYFASLASVNHLWGPKRLCFEFPAIISYLTPQDASSEVCRQTLYSLQGYFLGIFARTDNQPLGLLYSFQGYFLGLPLKGRLSLYTFLYILSLYFDLQGMRLRLSLSLKVVCWSLKLCA